MDVTRLAAQKAQAAARALDGTGAATPAGQRPQNAPRTVAEGSWSRVARGVAGAGHGPRGDLLNLEETERCRRTARLRHVLPVLHEGLLPFADSGQHTVLVADAEGRVLWREGGASGPRRADGHGLADGVERREGTSGPAGSGTSLATRRPVRVVPAGHFVRTLRSWACVSAPITDPRDGRLLGAVDVSGPLETHHPATLALVASVAKLAEARLRDLHLTSLERLRAVAAPVLARTGGHAVAVDDHGWTAAVTGMPYTRRLALPESLAPGRARLPNLGPCSVEPLPGGWLIRPCAEPSAASGTARLVLDLTRPHRWTVAVSGGTCSWTHELSLRHAELLYLLALHRTGRSAAALAADLFGDPARTVTVRAEISRVRRRLGAFLEHRPYRFAEGVDLDVRLPDDPLDLLPHSLAPGVVRTRETSAHGRPAATACTPGEHP
ncbi:helix-turn-helix domain-containing protein [Streptomyces poonensis]|nr:helix-turn-helix domain-containing protein [Streptomyces poonensis]